MRWWMALLALLAMTGCRGRYVFDCGNDSGACVRAGLHGQCRAAATGSASYCVFSDGACPQGRWDATAADGLAGRCVGEAQPDLAAAAGNDLGGVGDDLAGSPIADLSVSPIPDMAYATDDAAIRVDGCSTSAILYGVWGASVNDVWAVGTQGTILHFHGGSMCQVQANGVPANAALRAVWGRSATDLYAVGEFGVLLHSTNGGASWTNGSGQPALAGFWGVGGTATRTYAAVENTNSTAGGALWVTSNGSSWTQVSGVPADGNPLDTVWSNGTRVWVAGGGNNPYYSDDGTTWSPSNTATSVPGYFAAVAGPSGSTLIGVSSGATILRFDGVNWSTRFDHSAGGACGGGLYGLSTVPGRAIAVGKYGCVALSSDGGLSWRAFDMSSGSGTTANLWSVWSDPVSGHTVAVGDSGTVIVDPKTP